MAIRIALFYPLMIQSWQIMKCYVITREVNMVHANGTKENQVALVSWIAVKEKLNSILELHHQIKPDNYFAQDLLKNADLMKLSLIIVLRNWILVVNSTHMGMMQQQR